MWILHSTHGAFVSHKTFHSISLAFDNKKRFNVSNALELSSYFQEYFLSVCLFTLSVKSYQKIHSFIVSKLHNVAN